MTAYNLEKYVETAIISVINQKTDYDYQLLVVDDCSSDSTYKIIERLQTQYPDKIVGYRNENNLGSLASSNYLFSKLDAEYYSFLDGDDYWVDQHFIQNAIDFLDKNVDYSMYGGNTRLLTDADDNELLIPAKQTNRSYNLKDLILDRIPFVHTSSIVARNLIFKNGLPSIYKDKVSTFENCALRGEDFRRIHNLVLGPIYVSNDTRSTYRIHSMGMWQGSSDFKRKLETTIQDNFFRKYFAEKGKNEIAIFYEKKFKSSFNDLLIYVLFNSTNLLNEKSSNEIRLFASLLEDVQTKASYNKLSFSKRAKKKIVSLLMK